MKNKEIRLQKFLSERGIASRRRSAQYIREKRVCVNTKIITEPGTHINPAKDHVIFDDHPITEQKETHRTIIFYKPRGYVCSSSGQGNQTIYDLINNIKQRLVPVGRLDKNSEGLLIMSNDGDLVNRLTHPRFQHEKTYRVTVSGNVNAAVLKKMESPLMIDGYRTRPVKAKFLRKGEKSGQYILEFILKEGRKRQIRHICEQTGLKIHRLMRVKVGKLSLAGLKPGQWRDLSDEDMKKAH